MRAIAILYVVSFLCYGETPKEAPPRNSDALRALDKDYKAKLEELLRKATTEDDQTDRSRQELTFTLLSGPDMLGAW